MTQSVTKKEACAYFAAPENKKFQLLCHASPDADTVCSALALCLALDRMGKQVSVLFPEVLPSRLLSLPGVLETATRFSVFPGSPFSPDPKSNALPDAAKNAAVVSIDVADLSLLGAFAEYFRGKVDLMIDHHIKRAPFGKQYLIEPHAAAAAEIVFSLIRGLSGYGAKLDATIASLLYAGISSDTGSFRYSNTTKKTLFAAAHLYDHGIDTALIAERLHSEKPRSQVIAETKIGADMRFFGGGRIALVYADTSTLQTLGASEEDVSDIVSLPRQIEGVKIAVSVKEKPSEGATAAALRRYKISLRTSADVSAQKIAAIFGGGGHVRAAGCTIFAKNTEAAIEKIASACEQFL